MTITLNPLLVSSNDIQIANISRHQFKNIANVAGANNVISVNDFPSSQTANGIFIYRYKSKYVLMIYVWFLRSY